MRALAAAAMVAGVVLAAFGTACLDVTTNAGGVQAVGFDSIPAPSVVVGDTLRDTLGVARPLHGAAFNAAGAVLSGVPVIYRVLDRGAHVDSLTGVLVGDSVRTTPVRVLVDAGGIQTQPISIFVVPAPDTIIGLQALDTLLYSLLDSASQQASSLTVQLLHHVSPTVLDSVQAYIVSFAIQPALATPFAQLMVVDDGGRPSPVDTTASDGTAGLHRHLRLRLLQFPTAADSTDSVVVSATARYHGAVVPGSPVQIVVRLRPAS